jgi:hypothetical protein
LAAADHAKITGVCAFDLFRSFKKNRGYSQMEFVDKLRLGSRVGALATRQPDTHRKHRFGLRLR